MTRVAWGAVPGFRAPVAEQPWLGVLRAQRLPQERVGHEVDLADGQVIRRTPVRVDQLELFLARGGWLAGGRPPAGGGAARPAYRSGPIDVPRSDGDRGFRFALRDRRDAWPDDQH